MPIRFITPAERSARAKAQGPGPRPAHQTNGNAVASVIGMLTSRAEMACCWLQVVNGLAAAELLCADLRTQGAESL